MNLYERLNGILSKSESLHITPGPLQADLLSIRDGLRSVVSFIAGQTIEEIRNAYDSSRVDSQSNPVASVVSSDSPATATTGESGRSSDHADGNATLIPYGREGRKRP